MEPQVNRDSVTMSPPEPPVEPVRVVEQTVGPQPAGQVYVEAPVETPA